MKRKIFHSKILNTFLRNLEVEYGIRFVERIKPEITFTKDVLNNDFRDLFIISEFVYNGDKIKKIISRENHEFELYLLHMRASTFFRYFYTFSFREINEIKISEFFKIIGSKKLVEFLIEILQKSKFNFSEAVLENISKWTQKIINKLKNDSVFSDYKEKIEKINFLKIKLNELKTVISNSVKNSKEERNKESPSQNNLPLKKYETRYDLLNPTKNLLNQLENRTFRDIGYLGITIKENPIIFVEQENNKIDFEGNPYLNYSDSVNLSSKNDRELESENNMKKSYNYNESSDSDPINISKKEFMKNPNNHISNCINKENSELFAKGVWANTNVETQMNTILIKENNDKPNSIHETQVLNRKKNRS